MIAEEQRKTQIKVKFVFANDLTAKPCELLVNPYSPIFNYKTQLESQARMDLYGKKLVFKYTHNNSESFKIEYLQEIALKSKTDLKNALTVEVLFE
jgi:hypothetical protein